MSWTGSGSKVVKAGHLKSYRDELDKIEETYYPQDDIPPIKNWLEKEKVILPEVTIFTDGSRMEGISGCAYSVCKGDMVIAEEITPLGDVTVFKA